MDFKRMKLSDSMAAGTDEAQKNWRVNFMISLRHPPPYHPFLSDLPPRSATPSSLAGKLANVLLWRNKKISIGVLGGATIIWVLFELLEYHLLTLFGHCLILSLAILFL